MPCRIADFLDLVHQLEDVTRTDHDRYAKFEVGRRTLGYLWEPTRTVGLKQTIAEQLALVAERPDVFEVQFTAGRLRLGGGLPRRHRARRARRAHVRGLAAVRARRPWSRTEGTGCRSERSQPPCTNDACRHESSGTTRWVACGSGRSASA